MLIFPPFLLSLSTPYISLKIFLLISLVTQYITLPYFFLDRDRWIFSDTIPFGFTALETFPILLKISLFLFAVLFFFRLIFRLSWTQRSIRKFSIASEYNSSFKEKSMKKKIPNPFVINDLKTMKFSLLIFLLIPPLIILNLWMYSNGVGITGVAPPRLPYKMSGILFYFTKFLVPVLLGYLYFKSKRRFLLMITYLIYAWIFGLCATSKGAVLIIMTPVIALAWIDKRYFVFLTAALGTVVGVFLASGARYYVHYVDQNVTGADTTYSLFFLINSIVFDPTSRLWDLDFLPWMIAGIAGRVEYFGSLVQAQYYDPDAVVGAVGFLLRMIWTGLVEIDVDAHHIEWQGYILPKGFFNGGSILSNAIIVSNSALWWLMISGLITAVMLVAIEKSTNYFFRRYIFISTMRVPTIFYLTLLYFTQSSTSNIFVLVIIVMIVAPHVPFRPIKFYFSVKSK